jgi:hypothetical protein
MKAELDLTRVAVKGCCTVEDLEKFREQLLTKLSSEPDGNWIYASHNHVVRAYCNMIEISGFCSCKLIVLGWRLQAKEVWETIMQTGKFGLKQRRILSEVSGQWDEVCKLGPIFREPLSRDDIWHYAKSVDDSGVWCRALKTGLLTRENVRVLVKQKSSNKHWILGVPIMRTNMLRDSEALTYLKSLQNYCIEPAVEWAKVREFRRQELFNLAARLEKMVSPFLLFGFWIQALEKLDHRFDRNLLLRVLEIERERHRQNLDEISQLVVAAIRTQLLTKADRRELRQTFYNQSVREALLDVA